MTRLVLCALALLVAGALSDPVKKHVPQKVVDPVFLQKQLDLMLLFFHLHEPNHVEASQNIAKTWNLEHNIDHFSNVTAVTTYIKILEHHWVLPRAMPFNVMENAHRFEAVTMFNVLFSAKDYDTFYKTAVYLRDRVNEHLYAYVLSIAILNRHDTQGIYIPRIYEVFPSFFNNGEVMTTAQRINTHWDYMVDFFPSTYKWDDSIVIRKSNTTWPYYSSQATPVSYFTHDFGLNSYYYNMHLTQPNWLGGDLVPLMKDRRGEWFWFIHKQLLARYYMERLSNGLGEIPELGHEIVKDGYSSGLLYHNGIPFPVRPHYYHLEQPALVDELEEIYDYERRVRDAIDRGYVINHLGEHISLRNLEAIDVLGRVIESSIDSPNMHFYKDFISIWKKVLGNSVSHEHQYHHHFTPLVVPSVLEHYQTALRDPAFYMIWKRVLGLFDLWQSHLPLYKPEELALPQVKINKVDVDKMVTYFENSYMNVTTHLHMDEEERKGVYDKVSVLVQHPRLNHKKFQVRVNVKSEVQKSVLVRFFLAPKYNSHGFEIPLHQNSENFLQLDEFVYDLPLGESVITRDSTDNWWTSKDVTPAHQYQTIVEHALHGKERFVVDQQEGMIKPPHRLLLPKGRVGGMPFVFMVYISEYRAPKVQFGTGFDPAMSLGIGSGARHLSDEPLGFPVNRPLFQWQVEDIHNMYFEDVLIFHKHTPEIDVPHME